MSKHQLMCEICREIIGAFHTEDVEEPIKGAMFQSKDPRHGFPPPFRSPALEWKDMQCPYCSNRPFFARGYLLTERGHWGIEEDEFVDAPRVGLDERALVEKMLNERPDRGYDADIRARIDADRMGSVLDYDPADQALTESAPPTEAIPLNYGPDIAEESGGSLDPGPKYMDMTPEEKKADIARRIEMDAQEAEDGDSGSQGNGTSTGQAPAANE